MTMLLVVKRRYSVPCFCALRGQQERNPLPLRISSAPPPQACQSRRWESGEGGSLAESEPRLSSTRKFGIAGMLMQGLATNKHTRAVKCAVAISQNLSPPHHGDDARGYIKIEHISHFQDFPSESSPSSGASAPCEPGERPSSCDSEIHRRLESPQAIAIRR